MKITLLFAGIFFSIVIANAQSEAQGSNKIPNDSPKMDKRIGDEKNNLDSAFLIVEQMPEFPGGEVALYNYLNQNIKYPVAAYLNKVEGNVIVHFIIDSSGRTSNVQVLKSIGYGCDQAAVRLILGMPEWRPGYQKGEPVSVNFSMPVRFHIAQEIKTNIDAADILYLQAKERFNHEEYSKSMELLDQSLALNPYHINALQLRALLFAKNNESSSACQDLNFANNLWNEMMQNYFESLCSPLDTMHLSDE